MSGIYNAPCNCPTLPALRIVDSSYTFWKITTFEFVFRYPDLCCKTMMRGSCHSHCNVEHLLTSNIDVQNTLPVVYPVVANSAYTYHWNHSHDTYLYQSYQLTGLMPDTTQSTGIAAQKENDSVALDIRASIGNVSAGVHQRRSIFVIAFMRKTDISLKMRTMSRKQWIIRVRQ